MRPLNLRLHLHDEIPIVPLPIINAQFVHH